MKEQSLLIDGKEFTYTEIELFHGRKRIDRTIAKENLEMFYSIIKNTNIKYGLMYGTLLGAVREGNFIVHDEDTDIFVLEEDREAVLKLLFEFKRIGLSVVRVDKGLISLMRKNEYIDMYFFRKKRILGFINRRVYSNSLNLKAEYLEELTTINFLGMEFPITSQPEKLLEELYGSTWRTPIAGNPAGGNTIYDYLRKNLPFIKNLPYFNTVKNWLFS